MRLRRFQESVSFKTFLALGDQLVVSGTRFVSSWMIARYCGAEQLGLYALGFSVLILMDLVLQAFVAAPFTIHSQQVLGSRHARYTGNSLGQALFVGILGVSVFVMIGMGLEWFGSFMLTRVMYIIAVFVPFFALREFGRRFFFATSQFAFALAIDTVFSVFQLATMALMLECEVLDAGFAHLAGGTACAAALALWFGLSHRRVRFRLKPWRHYAVRHWRFGRWVFVSQVTNQLNWNAVQWIIAFWLSAEATGIFTGCLTIAFLSNPFVLGIANLVYPRMALTLSRDGQDAMQLLAFRAVMALGVVMVLFTAVLFFAGQSICDLLYADPAYVNTSTLLGFLSAAVSLLAISMPIDACLWAQQRTDLSSFASGIGLAVTTIAVLSMVDRGVHAASIGLLVGCIAESIARFFFYFRCRQASGPRVCSAAYGF